MSTPERPAASIRVKIIADTRGLRRELLRAQILCTRRWWNRLPLRLELWRINREPDPRG